MGFPPPLVDIVPYSISIRENLPLVNRENTISCVHPSSVRRISSPSTSTRMISSPMRRIHRHGTKYARSFPKKQNFPLSSGMIRVQTFPVTPSISRSQTQPSRLPSQILITSFSFSSENRSHFIKFLPLFFIFSFYSMFKRLIFRYFYAPFI